VPAVSSKRPASASAGNADTSLAASLGGFGEGGSYFIPRMADGQVAFVFTLRYSAPNDSAKGTTNSANSGGLIVALHLNL
jgi:hypothetical protein